MAASKKMYGIDQNVLGESDVFTKQIAKAFGLNKSTASTIEIALATSIFRSAPSTMVRSFFAVPHNWSMLQDALFTLVELVTCKSSHIQFDFVEGNRTMQFEVQDYLVPDKFNWFSIVDYSHKLYSSEAAKEREKVGFESSRLSGAIHTQTKSVSDVVVSKDAKEAETLVPTGKMMTPLQLENFFNMAEKSKRQTEIWLGDSFSRLNKHNVVINEKTAFFTPEDYTCVRCKSFDVDKNSLCLASLFGIVSLTSRDEDTRPLNYAYATELLTWFSEVKDSSGKPDNSGDKLETPNHPDPKDENK